MGTDRKNTDLPPPEVGLEHREEHRDVENENVGWHNGHLSFGDPFTVTRAGSRRIGPWVAQQVEPALFDLHLRV